MELIHHDGKLYKVFAWQKPEDTDCAEGECLFGIYKGGVFPGPVLVMARGDKTFKPLHYDFGDIQPLFVLDIPPLGEEVLVRYPDYFGKVGELRYETD